MFVHSFSFYCWFQWLAAFEIGPTLTASGKKLLGRGNGIVEYAVFPFSVHSVQVSRCMEREQDTTEQSFHAG